MDEHIDGRKERQLNQHVDPTRARRKSESERDIYIYMHIEC